MTPPLTVVSQPINHLAVATIENLIARLQGAVTGPDKETPLRVTLAERAVVSGRGSDLG